MPGAFDDRRQTAGAAPAIAELQALVDIASGRGSAEIGAREPGAGRLPRRRRGAFARDFEARLPLVEP